MTKNRYTKVNNMVTNESNGNAVNEDNTQIINTKFRVVDHHDAPLVKVAFEGKDGKVYVGYMLVDTGSMDCILNNSILPLLSPEAMHIDNNKEISSVQSKSLVCHAVDFTFKMGDGMFSEVFYTNDRIDLGEIFSGIVGIVGIGFLLKHKLVLDYSTESLRTSDNKVAAPSDCEFFFPIEFGLKHYSLPVVGIACNDTEYVMIVDSGANNTLLTQCMANELGGTVCDGGESTMTDFTNKTVATMKQNVDLSLISLGGADNDIKLYSSKDTVLVINDREHILDGYTDTDGIEVPPVSGLLSSDFMHTHKWVLDFGVGAMYIEKTA